MVRATMGRVGGWRYECYSEGVGSLLEGLGQE